MTTRRRNVSIGACLFAAALLLCLASQLALAQKQPSSNEPSSVAWQAPTEAKAEDYVGEETCAGCHADRAKQFAKTVHERIAPAGAQFGVGCEACHGPGRAHVEAASKGEPPQKFIYGFHGSPAENSARCLRCHSTSKEQDHFDRSEHKLQGVACIECHEPHLIAGTEKRERVEPSIPQSQFFMAAKQTEENRWLSQSLLRKPQPDLCFTCHRTIQAQFALPTHHRVPEGLMKCTDCHNPHGTMNRPLLRKANWEVCVSCHVEKRGPFVFEHASVKVEGCVACHSPHGSVTRNNLLRREGRFLCLQCHVDPFAANVPHSRFGFQTRGECVRCHVAIHGSNASEFFIQ